MSSRGGKKYRICTDSIAKTAGTPKRSTWSPAAKSRYDRCLRKVENNKYTNEQSPTQPTGALGSPTANANLAKRDRGMSRIPKMEKDTQFGQVKQTVRGGKKIGSEVSHTVYDRIGALLSEKKKSGRRRGEGDHREGGRPPRKLASKTSRFIAGGVVAALARPRLAVQGLGPLGPGAKEVSLPDQHRERSPR